MGVLLDIKLLLSNTLVPNSPHVELHNILRRLQAIILSVILSVNDQIIDYISEHERTMESLKIIDILSYC